MYLSWTRQREFVERYIRQARRAAWGDESGIKGIPGIDGVGLGTSAAPPSDAFAQENGQAVLNRRQKRMQEKEAKKEKKGGRVVKGSGVSTPQEPSEPETTGPQGSKKKVQAENGKILIVDSVGNVFLEEVNDDGETGEYLLDPEEIPKPTYRDTVVFRLPAWAFDSIRGRLLGRSVAVGKTAVSEDSNGGEDHSPRDVDSSDKRVRRGKKNARS